MQTTITQMKKFRRNPTEHIPTELWPAYVQDQKRELPNYDLPSELTSSTPGFILSINDLAYQKEHAENEAMLGRNYDLKAKRSGVTAFLSQESAHINYNTPFEILARREDEADAEKAWEIEIARFIANRTPRLDKIKEKLRAKGKYF